MFILTFTKTSLKLKVSICYLKDLSWYEQWTVVFLLNVNRMINTLANVLVVVSYFSILVNALINVN